MRKMKREVAIGHLKIGGKHPIRIQSMTNTPTSDATRTVAQLETLERAGCEIARLAFSNQEECALIPVYRQAVSMPLVADIQFDYKLAIRAMENGIDKVRFNPGNIGDESRVTDLVSCARANDVPIRIGVNSGSIEKEFLERYGYTSAALVESCLKHVAVLERCGYESIVLSVKSSQVATMMDAYIELSERVNYPLHVGVTEAGSYERAIVKSSIGIGGLLYLGIGDTIRVSVTGDPVREIEAAKSILQGLGVDKNFCDIISCPTCSRCSINLEKIESAVRERYGSLRKPLKLALMGCVVNGPGEARDADYGLAGGDGKGVLFQRGVIVKTVPEESLVHEFFKLVDNALANEEE